MSASGIDKIGLIDWWKGRAIPASRDGIRDALDKLNICNTMELLDKCFGLSLSDQYRICPKGSGLAWDDVNFFDNDFSEDVGEILFGNEPDNPKNINLISPDNTSDGWLRKKWIVADGRRMLMKGGTLPYYQQPFNEVIASSIMKRLGVSHIPYTLTFNNNMPYSLCETFVTSETELIPAWHIWNKRKMSDNSSILEHFLECCNELGALNIRDSINKMLTVDYIIHNEDRHFKNFGLVRNAETLEFIGFAPIYDSGTSLWYNHTLVGTDRPCRPFFTSHSEQIKLVSDFSWFDSDALDGLYEEIVDILSPAYLFDDLRGKRIADSILANCRKIEGIAIGKTLEDNPNQ